MASAAGCVAIWAKYETDVDPQRWEQLVRVTHWPEETVARDEELRFAAKGIHPDYDVRSFDELLRLIDVDADTPTRVSGGSEPTSAQAKPSH